MSEANRQHYEGCRSQLNAHLQGGIDRITAITTVKMENEAAKTGYPQQEVRDAYGANVSLCSHGSGSQRHVFDARYNRGISGLCMIVLQYSTIGDVVVRLTHSRLIIASTAAGFWQRRSQSSPPCGINDIASQQGACPLTPPTPRRAVARLW